MIKRLIQLAVLLVVGLVIYNFYLGTPEEQAQSEEIIEKVKDIGKSGVELVKAEKEKFDAGKYDDALDKVSALVEKLKSKAKDSQAFLDKVKDLEAKKDQIKEKLDNTNTEEVTGISAEAKQELQDEMKDLVKDIESLSEEMER